MYILRFGSSLPVCPLSVDLRLEMLDIRDVVGAIDVIIQDVSRNGAIRAGKLRVKEDQSGRGACGCEEMVSIIGGGHGLFVGRRRRHAAQCQAGWHTLSCFR